MNVERHCNLKVPLRLEDMRGLWSEVGDKVRLEILKSVIWTAPDCRGFYLKAMKILNSEKFREAID